MLLDKTCCLQAKRKKVRRGAVTQSSLVFQRDVTYPVQCLLSDGRLLYSGHHFEDISDCAVVYI